ncbi:hypothetical protein [Ralstonia solanacearum]|nr:hypothetical protein [Ralstonia solanacearum]
MISSLQEIVSLEEVQYILLDEWDANLDQDNTTGIDAVLDALASTKMIVEVRHLRWLTMPMAFAGMKRSLAR